MTFLTLKNVYFFHPKLSKGVIWKNFLSESSWSFHSLYNSRCLSGIVCFSKGNSWSVKLGRLWLHGSKSINWSVKLGNSSWSSHRTRHDCCRGKDRRYARWLIGKEPTSPPVQEMQVRSLDWEDPLEKVVAILSSIPAWKILWTKVPGGLQSMGSKRIGHSLVDRGAC